MKRVILAALALVAMVGCTKDSDVERSLSDSAVEFSASKIYATRLSLKESWVGDGSESVGIFTVGSNNYVNIEYSVSSTAGTLSDKGTKIHHPAGNKEETYRAYYPYDATVDGSSLAIDLTQQQDLLISDDVSDYESADSGVDFTFSHALSTFTLNLSGRYPYTDLSSDIKDLKIYVKCVSRATYDLSATSNNLSLGTTESAIYMEVASDNSSAKSIMLPADHTATKVIFIYTDVASGDEFIRYQYIGTTFASGYNHIFSAELSLDEVVLCYDTIAAWGSTTVEGVTSSGVDIAYNGSEYIIYTAAGLRAFANLANGVDSDAGAKCYDAGSGNFDFSTVALDTIDAKLMADIDLDEVAWTPIGYNYIYRYRGTFDGGGHLISGLKVTNCTFAGLFGANRGTIANIGVAGSVSDGDTAGGVVGYNSGTVANCYNTADVSGTTYIGGVVGSNDNGTVTNCYNTGSVSTATNTGSVVGYNSGTVANCYYLNTTPSDSNATAMTASEMRSADFVVTLNNAAYLYNQTPPTVALCAWVCNKVGYPTFDSSAELVYTADITYSDGIYTIYTAKGLWAFADLVNGSGSNTKSAITFGGDEYFDFTSSNTTIFGKLTDNIDLEEEEWTPIGASALYTGTFDGGGHLVSGLKVTNGTYAGLFRRSSGTILDVGVAGSLSYELGISWCVGGGVVGYNEGGAVTSCYNLASVSGYYYAGGVVGYNEGGAVTSCYNLASVSCYYYAGGVVGYNGGGAVTSCYNLASVSGDSGSGGVAGRCGSNSVITSCYNMGSLSSNTYAGGMIGVCGSENIAIVNCYNTASISSASAGGGVVGYNESSLTIVNCYNRANVSISGDNRSTYAGGMVGCNNSSAIILNNCYNTGNVSNVTTNGTAYAGSVIGWSVGGSYTNCYWLSGSASSGRGDNNSESNFTEYDQSDMDDLSFVTDLNRNATTYNTSNNYTFGESTKAACAWGNVDGSYPVLKFDGDPANEYQ